MNQMELFSRIQLKPEETILLIIDIQIQADGRHGGTRAGLPEHQYPPYHCEGAPDSGGRYRAVSQRAGVYCA